MHAGGSWAALAGVIISGCFAQVNARMLESVPRLHTRAQVLKPFPWHGSIHATQFAVVPESAAFRRSECFNVNHGDSTNAVPAGAWQTRGSKTPPASVGKSTVLGASQSNGFSSAAVMVLDANNDAQPLLGPLAIPA